MLALGTSGLHGRGVFAQRRFACGEVIERAPVLVIPAGQVAHLDRTSLHEYYFVWGDQSEHAALAMGFGSFYNHAIDPNAHHLPYPDELVIEFVALRDIALGDEITIHYNGTPGDPTPVWFQR